MRTIASFLLAVTVVSTVPLALSAQALGSWRQHDTDRPRPALVTPGATAAAAPSDATVLFDGSSLMAWRSDSGTQPARWVMRDGYMEAAPGTGALQTAVPLGDMQLHLEWATPVPATGRGQGRGNSGVIIMGRYELQILDSYDNTTYADGQAGAVYGQYPPLVNASRPSGAWQSYDIIFHGPRWSTAGALTRPARITAFHNGVLVQDDVALWGGTNWLRSLPYEPHAARLPLVLQDHSNPIRFRNIWVRELPETPALAPRPGVAANARRVTVAQLKAYVGTYRAAGGDTCRVVLKDGALGLVVFDRPDVLPLVTSADGNFTFRHTAGSVRFTPGAAGGSMRLDVSIAEVERQYVRAP